MTSMPTTATGLARPGLLRQTMLASVLAALALCASATPAAAGSLTFSVNATRGYSAKVTVGSGGEVVDFETVFRRRSDGATVSYSPANREEMLIRGATATVSYDGRGTALQGRMELSFRPRGRLHAALLPRGCSGSPGRTVVGQVVGTIRLRAERGYSTVTASRAPARLTVGQVLRFCGGPTGQVQPTVTVVDLSSYSSLGRRFMTAQRAGDSVAFYATDQPNAAILREVRVRGAASQFLLNDEHTLAVLSPPSPFSGQATVQTQDYETTQSGVIRVNFPGAGLLPVSGPGGFARLEDLHNFPFG